MSKFELPRPPESLLRHVSSAVHHAPGAAIQGESTVGDEFRQFPSLAHITRWRARQQPQQIAFTFLVDGESKEENLTFADLDRLATITAARLREAGAKGDRVLILQEPGIDYIVSLFGCLYAGLIAVPVYPPEMLRLQATLPRLQAITKDADARIVLSSQALIDGGLGERWATQGSSILPIEAVRSGSDRDMAPDFDKLFNRSAIALLQYTSGSTGTPRGVALTHNNLLANLAAAYDVWDVPNAVAVHWLPPYHDMGLIGGILLPVYGGRRVVLMAPQTFLQRPFRLLQAFHRYQGTSTGTPNFGFEICTRKVTAEECLGLDLSSWKVAVVGAEPVRAETMRRFIDKFSPYGFHPDTICPAYGMAESTVVISGKRKYTKTLYCDFKSAALQNNQVIPASAQDTWEERVTLVGCGPAIPTTEVRIVNPETKRLAGPGEVGEIWVRGPSVAAGYWNQPEVSQELFHATLADDAPGPGYLRTGDLGFEYQNQFFINGRLKELVIIAGKNYYPHDIEKAVQTTNDAFRVDHGAAFSVELDREERLVLLQEVTRPKKWDLNQLLTEAHLAITHSLGISPYEIVLVASGSLPKTSSGKLRRRECKAFYLRDELRVLARWNASGGLSADLAIEKKLPQTSTEKQVALIWQEILDIDPLHQQDNFLQMGGHSLTVTQMLQQVSRSFGCDLPLSFLFEHPTLAGFSQALDLKRAESSGSRSEPSLQLPPILPLEPAGSYPLSHSQRRFWYLDQLGKRGAFSLVPVTLKIQGQLDSSRLQRALDQVVDRHPVLRGCFLEVSGELRQRICEQARVQLVAQDLRNVSPPTVDQRLAEIKTALTSPFDLTKAPLFRAALIQTDADSCQLMLVFHHIICDGWSLHLLLQDLAIAYTESSLADTDAQKSFVQRIRGAEAEPLQYVDFAAWEQSPEVQDRFARRLPYWQARLADAPTTLELPTDRPRHRADCQSAETLTQTIDRELYQQIERLADRFQTTPFVVFLSMWYCVLSKYSGSADVVVGIPTANRIAAEIAKVVGCFINTVPMRTSLESHESLASLFARVRGQVLADLEAGDIPFDRLIENLPLNRQSERLPLVQHLFLYQPPFAHDLPFEAASVQAVRSDYSSLFDFDMTLVVEHQDQVEVKLVYPPALFDAVTVQRILGNFIAALKFAVHSPDEPVANLPIPADAERCRLLAQSEGTCLPIPQDGNAADMIERVVRMHPSEVAVMDAAGAMTYAELDSAANRLASWLNSQGIRSGDFVGICLQRSRQMLVSMLAVWKVGAAYVPLDPHYPAARVNAMLEDCALRLVLTESPFAGMFSPADVAIGLLDQLQAKLQEFSDAPPVRVHKPDDLAYLIYTSGSTGKPKGVMVRHRGVLNLLQSFAQEPGFSKQDRLLALTTMSFDISVLELFLPLSVGGQVVIAESRVAENPQAVSAMIDAPEITVVQGTPSTFRLLLATGWRPKKRLKIFCGGEPLPAALGSELASTGSEVWNVYGPTETTVWSTLQRVATDDKSISIGRPIANTALYVVDPEQRLVPAGVPGELWIGGEGVAAGYWNRPELTAEKFVTFSPDKNSESVRCYRTGDLVRWQNDGTLQFLARVDRQVKLRGHRIELGEIEAALVRHPQIQEAAVVMVGEADAAFLVGYYSALPDGEFSVPQILSFLRKDLPEYMIPAHFVFCATIPHTPAGKVDYRSLPQVEHAASSAGYILPRTELEAEMWKLWVEVLQHESLGVEDNFFEVGGHSLKAAQLFIRIRDQLAIELPLKDLYEHPTIARLAERIISIRLAASDSEDIARLLEQLERMPDSD